MSTRVLALADKLGQELSRTAAAASTLDGGDVSARRRRRGEMQTKSLL